MVLLPVKNVRVFFPMKVCFDMWHESTMWFGSESAGRVLARLGRVPTLQLQSAAPTGLNSARIVLTAGGIFLVHTKPDLTNLRTNAS